MQDITRRELLNKYRDSPFPVLEKNVRKFFSLCAKHVIQFKAYCNCPPVGMCVVLKKEESKALNLPIKFIVIDKRQRNKYGIFLHEKKHAMDYAEGLYGIEDGLSEYRAMEYTLQELSKENRWKSLVMEVNSICELATFTNKQSPHYRAAKKLVEKTWFASLVEKVKIEHKKEYGRKPNLWGHELYLECR